MSDLDQDAATTRCLFCGGAQAHRLRDVIVGRFLAGEGLPDLARDYDRTEAEIEEVLRVALREPPATEERR